VGPAGGATDFFLSRLRLAAGRWAGLHRHDGDEAFRVLRGRMRFTVGGRHLVRGAGEIALVPRGVEHGFVCLDDAEVELLGVPGMGQYVTVLAAGGARREVEWREPGHLWRRAPEAGEAVPTAAEMLALTETRRHLL
jgi:hypothetical protein